MRVAVNSYHNFFQPGTQESFFAPTKDVVQEAGEDEEEGRGELMKEAFEWRNAATEGVNTDAVERANEMLRGVYGDVVGEAEAMEVEE
jgi:hypothetical protein